jgi:hypothetical protein
LKKWLAKMQPAMKPFRSVLLAIALCASGCATTATTSGAFQYARDVGSREAVNLAEKKGEVTVVWRYGPAEWVSTMCGGRLGDTHVHGCAMRDPGSDRCVLFLVEPKDFQDRERLAVLGHEFWHCTGARHS